MPAQILLALSAAIMVALGLVQLLLMIAAGKPAPRGPIVPAASVAPAAPGMARVAVPVPPSRWQRNGFTSLHSLGAIFFGWTFGYLAWERPMLFFHSRFLGTMGLAILFAYLFLTRRQWRGRPFLCIALALFLYAAGFAIANIRLFT